MKGRFYRRLLNRLRNKGPAYLGLGLSCLITPAVRAQQTPSPVWRASVQTGGWVAGGKAQPFWLRTNLYGTIPLTTPAATLGAGLWKAYSADDTTGAKPRRRFNWSAGVQVVANAAARNRILLPEGYGKVSWKWLELGVGRWKQVTGLGDSALSSGFINGSGNALPLPKIQVATRGYVPLGFVKGFIAVNAGYSHGWFNVPYIQGSYLHQKYLYVRLGKPVRRVKVYAGINHEVQWGG